MNLFLMLLAAAPETCWAMIPEVRERKGSIVSASLAGLNTRQWFLSMTGLRVGSTFSRWATASSSKHLVVVAGFCMGLEGDPSKVLELGGTWVPLGVTSVAFV